MLFNHVLLLDLKSRECSFLHDNLNYYIHETFTILNCKRQVTENSWRLQILQRAALLSSLAKATTSVTELLWCMQQLIVLEDHRMC